jgi:hypothetical protein
VTNESPLNLVVHHPRFGIALKDEMDKLGIECVVMYRDKATGQMVRHGGGPLVRPVDFLAKHFTPARKAGAPRDP